MVTNQAKFGQGWPVRAFCTVAMLAFAWMILSVDSASAQNTPPFIVTPITQLAAYNANATSQMIQGFTGGVSTNSNGDAFLGGFNSNTTYEFPANGAAPIAVYNATTSGHAGATAVDNNQNLIVSEVYNEAVYLIPYVNGSYTPYSAPSTAPAACTSPTPTAPCLYDGPLNVASGYYFQTAALAFDAAGDSFVATGYDNNGSNHVYECSVACNYSGGSAVEIVQAPAGIKSLAVDSIGDVFYVTGSTTVYEVAAGQTNVTSTSASNVALSTAFNTADGVAVDSSGNLYVTDNNTSGTGVGGVYEIPLVGGTLSPANMFLVLPVTSLSYGSGSNYQLAGVAFDRHGNLFSVQNYDGLGKYTLDNVSMPATAIASTSSGTTLYVSFTKSVTLQGSTVTMAGAASSEFSITPPTQAVNGVPACTIGAGATANATDSQCLFTVTFSPTQPGLRTAILTLTDTAGDSVQVYLSGVGLGQAVTVDPGTQTALGGNWVSPSAVATDASGNVFLADAGANAVYEYALGAGTGTSVGSGLSKPSGVATDAAGNLYIADTGNSRVVMVPNVAGALNTAGQTVLLSAMSNAPGALAVAADGTLYIAEPAANSVMTYVSRGALGGSVFQSNMSATLANPSGLALDANNNLYIADTGNNRVVEMNDGNISTVGSGLSTPTGVAVDGSGSVVIADTGNARIVRVPNEGGALNSSDQLAINTTIAKPYAVQLDISGNLYVADAADAAAYNVNRISGTLNLGKVNINQSGAAENAYLASSGPGALTIGSPLFAPLAAGSPFSLTPSTNTGCTNGASLNSGFTCALSAIFSPSGAMSGVQSDAVALTTGAQNTASPVLNLTGNAVNLALDTVTLVQTSPASGSVNYGSNVTVTATIAAPSGVSGTPTGTVTFIVDGASGTPQLLSTSATVADVLSNLSGGTHSVVAVYSGDNNFAPESSSTLTVTVVPDSSTTALTVTGYASSPISAEPAGAATGSSVTIAATVVPSAPGAFGGAVTFTSGSTVLGTASLVTGGSSTAPTYTATLQTSLAAGTYNIVATYNGNQNYTSSATAAVPLVVTMPTYTLTASSNTLTASNTGSNTATLTLTSYSNYTGAVDFKCIGLPANAVCNFLPHVVQFQAINTSIPYDVPAQTTTVQVLINQPPIVTPTAIFWWTGILLSVGLLGFSRNRSMIRRLQMLCIAGLLMLVSMAGLSGCGSAYNSSAQYQTPSGGSKITIQAVSSPTGVTTNAQNITQQLNFTLTAQ